MTLARPGVFEVSPLRPRLTRETLKLQDVPPLESRNRLEALRGRTVELSNRYKDPNRDPNIAETLLGLLSAFVVWITSSAVGWLGGFAIAFGALFLAVAIGMLGYGIGVIFGITAAAFLQWGLILIAIALIVNIIARMVNI
jgi:hypothetical protein